ncbi:MAG: serine/threonine-protein kinase, partial [Opitutales bacterium]
MTFLNVDTRVDGLRIVCHLDDGLLGDTYEVFDEERRETFALKVMKRQFVEEVDFSDRFLRECQVIFQLEHDAVSGLEDFGVSKWRHWLKFQYFEGFEIEGIKIRTLLDYLRLHPTGLPEEEVVFLTRQLFQALEHAHGIGLLHRNLKPSNVMLRRGEDDRLDVWIADFGLVRLLGEELFQKLWQSGEEEATTPDPANEAEVSEDDEPVEQELSSAEETKMFRGPEELAGHEGEESGDFYALACIAYWALTGEPFPEDRQLRLSADLNSGWRAWILRGTESNPSDRFTNVSEALSQLPSAGTSLRYAEMPFEREGRHLEDRVSPYREGTERSTDGGEKRLPAPRTIERSFKPLTKFLLLIAGICFAAFGFWLLYRNAYHSPFVIYKCDYSGFDDAYKLGFGFYEGEVQWRGWFDKEQRSASGQWKIGDDDFYHVRVSLIRKRL